MRKNRQAGRRPRRSAAKERFWRGHIARQTSGKMSIRDYCARHALSEPSFYAWRAELSRRDELQRENQAAARRESLTRPAQREGRWPPQFVRLDVQPAAGTGLIEIVLGDEGLRGAVVRVPQGADRATLEAVLTALTAVLRGWEGLPC